MTSVCVVMTSLLSTLHLQEEEPEYRITAERKSRIEEFFLRKHTDEGFDLLKLTMSKRHSRKSSRPSDAASTALALQTFRQPAAQPPPGSAV